MNVLSLFDGMSCGRLALDSLGIKVDNYYAAEIDKYATQVSEANYPDIIRLGDVCGVKAENLPKIDLLLAGSPCQGFSFAGKQLAFDDPRSALFFEFVRILKECKPKYFLLENVKMKKEFLDIITQQVDAQPILINSALLSAQNRQRYYWTNIPGVEQPKQKGVVLKDILETGNISEEYKYSQKSIDYMNRGNEKWKTTRRADKYQQTADKEKSFTVTANWHKGVPYNFFQDDIKTLEKEGEEFDKNLDKMTNKEGKAYCLTARYDGAVAWNSIEKKQRTMIPVVQETHDKPLKVGMNVEEVKVRKHEVDIPSLQYLLREMKVESKKTNKQIAEETNQPITKVEHWFRTDSSFAIPGDDVWLKLKEVLGIHTEVFDKPIMEFEYRDGVYETKQRVYSDKGKAPTLTAGNTEQYIETHNTPKVVAGAWRGRSLDKDGKNVDWKSTTPKQMLELRKDEKSNALSQVTKDNVVVENETYWRKLTCRECERLQTVPDDYTASVSNTQRYKMLGNGWTIEVVAHILQNMKTLEEGGEVAKTKGQQGFEF